MSVKGASSTFVQCKMNGWRRERNGCGESAITIYEVRTKLKLTKWWTQSQFFLSFVNSFPPQIRTPAQPIFKRDVLSLYRRIFRIARQWQAAVPAETEKERQYMREEARKLFHRNKEVSFHVLFVTYKKRSQTKEKGNNREIFQDSNFILVQLSFLLKLSSFFSRRLLVYTDSFMAYGLILDLLYLQITDPEEIKLHIHEANARVDMGMQY